MPRGTPCCRGSPRPPARGSPPRRRRYPWAGTNGHELADTPKPGSTPATHGGRRGWDSHRRTSLGRSVADSPTCDTTGVAATLGLALERDRRDQHHVLPVAIRILA